MEADELLDNYDVFLSPDDVEDANYYKKGGYHPVKIGDIYNNRYTIEAKLGWGHFSTVWLATDNQVSDDHQHKLVALKIQKSETHYMEAAMDEIDLLNDASKHAYDNVETERGSKFVVQLLDHFMIHGPHGKHACLVFETMGKNILNLIKKYEYRGIPNYMVKIMTRQLLEGLQYLHESCKIIHTDLKPENFLLLPAEPFDVDKVTFYRQKYVNDQLKQQRKANEIASNALHGYAPAFDDLSRSSKTKKKNNTSHVVANGMPFGIARQDKNVYPWTVREQQRRKAIKKLTPVEHAISAYTVKVSDLGNACWTHRHFTEDIATRQYRAPEVIVGLSYDTPVDIWAVACIVFELITGDYLFDPKSDPDGRHSRSEDHLALMRELLGAFPKKFQQNGAHSRQFFTRKGDFINIRNLQHWPLHNVLTDKYGFSSEESRILSDSFLLPMLSLNPPDRATAAESLKSEWLQMTPWDLACMYKEQNCLETLPPTVAIKVIEYEKKRSVEVNQFVTSTRFSESRLERHIRKHCPYTAWVADNYSCSIDSHYEDLVALVKAGNSDGKMEYEECDVIMKDVNRMIQEVSVDSINARLEEVIKNDKNNTKTAQNPLDEVEIFQEKPESEKQVEAIPSPVKKTDSSVKNENKDNTTSTNTVPTIPVAPETSSKNKHMKNMARNGKKKK